MLVVEEEEEGCGGWGRSPVLEDSSLTSRLVWPALDPPIHGERYESEDERKKAAHLIKEIFL